MLLIELHLAAKAILARPLQVRGGPWLTVRALSADVLKEIRLVASCKSLVELSQLVEALPASSRVWEHMKNVRFISDLSSSSTTVPLPSLSVSGPPMIALPTSEAKTSPKSKAKAEPKAQAKAQPKAKAYSPPAAIYRFVRKKKSSGTSEDGHRFRTRNGIYDGHPDFDAQKYGNKPRREARQTHDQAYDCKRIRKKPATQ